MVAFNDWCTTSNAKVGNHDLFLLTGKHDKLPTGVEMTAAVVPGHYASEERISHALARLGKPAAADLIQNKLPKTKRIRSGDLGEIYATEWIGAYCQGYAVPIKRLRWKDHREMAMRGEDVIAIGADQVSQRIRFLKTEAKSRAKLTGQALTEARAGLDKNNGLPSPHALGFISDRLSELNESSLADAIDDAMLKNGIPIKDVGHLLFSFSGNNPKSLLTASLNSYRGNISQSCVGLRVDGHAAFIKAVYERVIANGNNT